MPGEGQFVKPSNVGLGSVETHLALFGYSR